MDYRRLGQSDLRVSTICMGCWAIVGGGLWGPQDEATAIAGLRAAYDCGINFFDTAEMYGDGYSEELVGRALGDVRSKIIIGSKVGEAHLKPADLRLACETSLRRLGTDYIDVYYIHWPNWQVPYAETMGEMERLRAEGKIRVVACSNFGKRDLSELLAHGRVEADELPYNLLWRAIEYEILPTCADNGVGVTCYSPLLQGLLTGKFPTVDDVPAGRARTRHFAATRPGTRHGEPGAEVETFAALDAIRRICDEAGLPMSQVALSWLLYQPGITSIVAGVRNPAQAQENADAASVRLSPDVLAALSRVTEPLKQKLGANADLWQSASRIR